MPLELTVEALHMKLLAEKRRSTSQFSAAKDQKDLEISVATFSNLYGCLQKSRRQKVAKRFLPLSAYESSKNIVQVFVLEINVF